jgi:3',5'-cyclic AMP phosphodiesterase CpdA
MSRERLVIQISDPHFGTEVGPVVKALTELVHSLAPALLIVSGDITQRARRAQFSAAQQFVAQLRAEHVLVVPGNHDIPLFNLAARFLHPYGNFARAFGQELEPEFESEWLMVLGVKTTRTTRHKDGEVSPEQIERVARRLRAARPEQLRIVVTHQPLHVIRDRDLTNLLHGHERAARCWAEAGADVLMGGHIHLPYVRPLSERLADLERAVWVVQAGTAVSRRVRAGAPNSINLLRYPLDHAGAYHVERWDYAAASGRFERVEQHRLTLDRNS